MVNLKSKIQDIPKTPGIYQFLNKDAKVIYIGKAKNLKSRVSQYFTGHDTRPQLPYLMAEAVDINYTVVSTELEAVFLENTLIKQHSPKYNIDLKDDKNYAFITIDYSTEIPQISYVRKIENRSEYNKLNPNTPNSDHSDAISRLGSRYFGPYSAVHKIRSTLNLVRRIFPYCANEKVSSRPCFYYYMHRCPGVCIGKISLEEYKTQINRIGEFLTGNTSKIVTEIKKEMLTASKNKKFEKAARLRDSLRALEILQEKQSMILPKKVDWDLISIAESDGFACINLFKVRLGKLYDKENFIYELAGSNLQTQNQPTNDYKSDVLQRFLEQYYLETSSRPSSIYLQLDSKNPNLIKSIIRSRFNRSINILVPQKGKPKSLINLGQINSNEYLKNWLKDKAGNLDKINNALNDLKELLNLPAIPKRIECYDNSHIQGTNPVGSMVVFENGLPAKSQYRKFKFAAQKNPPTGGDDFGMMKEMLARRLARSDKLKVTSDKSQWPLPDLIIIDGGKGQLSAAIEIISQFPNFSISVIGLAKRIEEIFLPNNPIPIILDHNHPSLQLLQRLRDEAHRFGITFHRSLRSKEAIKSALDIIPGVGPKTKKLLKTKFGTVGEIKKRTIDELAKVVGQKLAEEIKKHI